MEGSHANWKSTIYRKGAVHCTQIERSFSATKSFNTSLEHILLPYVIISNVHVCSFTGTIFHVHERATRTVLRARNLMHEKL